MPANLEEDAVVTQQTTLEQRRQQAHETAARLGLTMPLLLDEMDNAASIAFAAWPERLVVAMPTAGSPTRASPGPWGFLPRRRRSSSRRSSAADIPRGRQGPFTTTVATCRRAPEPVAALALVLAVLTTLSVAAAYAGSERTMAGCSGAGARAGRRA